MLESTLKQFRTAYLNNSSQEAVTSLCSIAFNSGCGTDDLYEAKRICEEALVCDAEETQPVTGIPAKPVRKDFRYEKNIKAVLEKLHSTSRTPQFVSKRFPRKFQWVILCSLLSNVNYLTDQARNGHDLFEKCLTVAVERACTALHFYVDSVLSPSLQHVTRHPDVCLVPIFCERARICARLLSAVGGTEMDPISILKKELIKGYMVLLRKIRSLQKLPTVSHEKMHVGEHFKNAQRAISVFLIELWRLSPFSVSIVLTCEEVDRCSLACSHDLASLLYCYFALYHIHNGNLLTAELTLVKAISYNLPHHKRTILLLWASLNLARGYLLSTRAIAEHDLSCLHGITLAVQSGRLDVYQACMITHLKEYARYGVLFPLMAVRLIVARNLVLRYYASLSAPSETQVDLQELWHSAEHLFDYAFKASETSENEAAVPESSKRFHLALSPIFPTVEHFRDHYLIPLVLGQYINGCIYLDYNVLKLSRADPFPDIPLRDGPAPQPPEPRESNI